MLKWLRKYNTVILVIGGVLLMVAWLLPQTIQQLGRTPLGAAPMKMAGRRVSFDAYDQARREWIAVNSLLPMYAQRMSALENSDHWILALHEAQKGGYLGGKEDGLEFLSKAAEAYAQMNLQQQFMFQQPPADRLDAETRAMLDQLTGNRMRQVMADTRMSEDDVLRAVGKLRGIARMRQAYWMAPRFSDRRLVAAVRKTDDAATVDYLFIPPDREMAGIADPDAAALQAHFDKYKSVKPGEGDYGVGYLLPSRVKIAWMVIDRPAIEQAITPDPVEVRKRFVKAFPTGQPPAGQTEESVMSAYETAVRTEQTEKVIRAIDVAYKGEIEKATRKLDADGEYKKVTEGWQRPDFETLREVIVTRVKEVTGVTIPAPRVEIRAAEWLTSDDIAALGDVGGGYVVRGNQTEMFRDLVLKVRELAGNNDTLLQVGIPYFDALTNASGGRFYFMVLDARKESAPDSVDEIRAKAIQDYKRIAAFEILKTKVDSFRQIAVSQGLETLAKSPSPDGSGDLPITTGIRVDGNSVANGDANVNFPEFRQAVHDAAAKLDPLADIASLPLDSRTVVVPNPKAQGVAAARIMLVAPVTVERYRVREGSTIQTVLSDMIKSPDDDPYSLSNLEKRLNVEYMDGRTREKPRNKASDEQAGKA